MPKFYIQELYLYEVDAENEEQALEIFQEFMEAGENDELEAKFLENRIEIQEAK